MQLSRRSETIGAERLGEGLSGTHHLPGVLTPGNHPPNPQRCWLASQNARLLRDPGWGESRFSECQPVGHQIPLRPPVTWISIYCAGTPLRSSAISRETQ
jgi:hypothetical protein